MYGTKQGKIKESFSLNPLPECVTTSGRRLRYSISVTGEDGIVSYVLDMWGLSDLGLGEDPRLSKGFLDAAAPGRAVEYDAVEFEGLSLVTQIWVDRGDGKFI